MGAEELIKRTYSYFERPCTSEACKASNVEGDVEFVTKQTLAFAPQYYSLLWVWEGAEATGGHISSLLGLLPLTLDLSREATAR